MSTRYIVFLLLFAGAVSAQPPEKGTHNGTSTVQGVSFRSRSLGTTSVTAGTGGFWLERKITNPEFMQKVGLSEEQVTKLRAEWKKLEEQSQKLEEQIHQLARQQAELAKQVLAEAGSDTTEVMNLIEKIGKLRIEQAKTAMQRVIIIRDYLTQEQRTKLSKILDEDQKKWRAARDEAQKRREQHSAEQAPKK